MVELFTFPQYNKKSILSDKETKALEEIKELIEKAVDLLQKDPALMENFKKNPIKVVEKLLGIDLPDDKIEAIVQGIKAKLQIDDAADVLGKLGSLFGKK